MLDPNDQLSVTVTPTSLWEASGFGGALSNVSYRLSEMKKFLEYLPAAPDVACNRCRPQSLRLG